MTAESAKPPASRRTFLAGTGAAAAAAALLGGPLAGTARAAGPVSPPATLQNLDPTPFFKQYGDNAWAIFKAYLDAASAQAAAPVTKKYLGKLAAADVFTFDNAVAVVESLRIDGGVLGPFGDHP